jgi:HEXXH motif-containing protein
MTSPAAADALYRDLCFAPARSAPSRPGGYRFALDFDSSRTWPDLPYDTAAPASHYPPAERAGLLTILDAASAMVAARAPAVLDFTDRHADTLMLRRSPAIAGASSSSNRAMVGTCLFTNLHAAPDVVHVCVEGVLHESIHQHLYRTERASGNFCDLDDGRTYRSPWSGNRIPLHSLVHAAFVWFGLLNLWTLLGASVRDDAEARLIAERVSAIRFGFAFLESILDGPAFPRESLDPAIRALLGRFAAETAIESVHHGTSRRPHGSTGENNAR